MPIVKARSVCPLTQVPAVQVCPVVQTVPQAPQLLLSVCGLTQTPLQVIFGALQAIVTGIVTLPVAQLVAPLQTDTLIGQDVGPVEGAVQVVVDVVGAGLGNVPQVEEVHAYVVLVVVPVHEIERAEVPLTLTDVGFATRAWQTGDVIPQVPPAAVHPPEFAAQVLTATQVLFTHSK